MKRTIMLVMALAGLLLLASGSQATSSKSAMSPVGAWAGYNEPGPGSPGEPNTTLTQYYRSGITNGGAWTDPYTNVVGSWEKVAPNQYRSTFYGMIPDAGGMLRINEEFWMLSKDEMEGRFEILWVPGQDPLGDAVATLFWGSMTFRRIDVRPMGLP